MAGASARTRLSICELGCTQVFQRKTMNNTKGREGPPHSSGPESGQSWSWPQVCPSSQPKHQRLGDGTQVVTSEALVLFGIWPVRVGSSRKGTVFARTSAGTAATCTSGPWGAPHAAAVTPWTCHLSPCPLPPWQRLQLPQPHAPEPQAGTQCRLVGPTVSAPGKLGQEVRTRVGPSRGQVQGEGRGPGGLRFQTDHRTRETRGGVHPKIERAPTAAWCPPLLRVVPLTGALARALSPRSGRAPRSISAWQARGRWATACEEPRDSEGGLAQGAPRSLALAVGGTPRWGCRHPRTMSPRGTPAGIGEGSQLGRIPSKVQRAPRE